MTALDDFFTHYYARRPVNATFTGVHAYDDQLPDWSPDGLAAMDDEMASLGAALGSEFPVPASPATFRNSPDLLDAELARGFLEVQRAEHASLHGPRGNPALWSGEAVFSIVSLMIREFASDEERAELASARCGRLGEFLSGPQRPVPRPWVERAVRDCDGGSILLRDGFPRWLAALDLPAERRAELERSAAAAVATLSEFSSRMSVHPEAPESAMSCGPDMYDLLLARGHCCTRARGDLLADARERFAAARAELDSLARNVAGSIDDALAALAAIHPTPDEYLSTFESIWGECHALAERANVIAWPEWPIRYVPFPEWTADAAPHLYYLYYRSPSALDPYTMYDYVVPPLPIDPAAAERHLRVWNTSTIKLNHVVHHGAIGHHVQNWYAYHQQRSRFGAVAAVDCANRIGMFAGGTMAEGWACYATDLMEELGFLTPLEQVSQQHSRVRMLARAIVDIELHQGSMTLTDAIRFYTDQIGMGTAAARSEAVKNSMFPCTAIMYWLGTQGIHDLRAEFERREGARFSLRRFHGALLGAGSVPVPLVSRMLTAPPSGKAGQ